MFLIHTTPKAKPQKKRLKEYSNSKLNIYTDEIRVFIGAYENSSLCSKGKKVQTNDNIERIFVQYEMGKLPKAVANFLMAWKKATIYDKVDFKICTSNLTAEFSYILSDIQEEFGVNTERLAKDDL